MLPLEIKEPSKRDPKTIVLYGPPKIGKTELLSVLEGFLLIDLEDGSDYARGHKMKLIGFKPQSKESGEEIEKRQREKGEYYFSELYTDVREYRKKHKKDPFKGIGIDTITELESWCEDDATYEYMSMNQGRNFNRIEGKEPFLKDGSINPDSIVPKRLFKSVLTLPKGIGYLHLRNSFKKWKGVFDDLAEHKIFIAHVKDIFLEKQGEEVSARDLDLTGKIKNITCSHVDAIGVIYRSVEKPLELRVSFKNNDNSLAGSRARHLRNTDFVIAVNNEDGTIKEHFWKRIFTE